MVHILVHLITACHLAPPYDKTTEALPLTVNKISHMGAFLVQTSFLGKLGEKKGYLCSPH
jgi:hypothetical protein